MGAEAMCAGELYSSLQRGDVCDLPVEGRTVRVVVDCAFIAFNQVMIVDKHYRNYQIPPMALISVVERAS